MGSFPPGPGTTTGILDREFGPDELAGLRQAVLGCATACGMPADRALDMMLAAHELAANAVRHGPGHGRLRIHYTASLLRCEVSDPGPARRDHHPPDHAGTAAAAVPGAVPWSVERGHGLWLVREVADRLHVISGPGGSLITAEFALPDGLA
jgi:anti-sigma regulatory factor (Ser/Thr protein kinase)